MMAVREYFPSTRQDISEQLTSLDILSCIRECNAQISQGLKDIRVVFSKEIRVGFKSDLKV